MANKYTFKLFPSKQTTHSRTHWCDSDSDAKHELTGMMYAMFFDYKHPHAELWRDGKLIHSMS